MKNLEKIKSQLKEKCFRFYACDWNPNGTNDLLITNEGDCEILEVIPEALFGVKVDLGPNIHEGCLISHAYTDYISLIDRPEFDPEYHTALKEVSLETVFEKIAVSPTQNEIDILKQLLKIK